MTVIQGKATAITAQDAGQMVNSFIARGNQWSEVGLYNFTSGDSIASVARVARIPSNARMCVVSAFCAAITTCAADIGLYQTAANGGAVVDADFFIAAQTLAAASAGINVIGGNVLSPANREKRVWEALGLTADPQREYDVAFTLTAAAGSAGVAGLELEYVI